ncbi:TetR/AcrR family transcriptional regulator [Paenibacillus sp. MMS20-IR301]|uniref:TetR/AcrR family transcriptional regulator n=1 Tax=Paenibacillus sp. MMS20-IR301 TaxID=2895946 RepID=UPI0028E74371|nr:TetR/AcrR family transcriptional regulator [Paenibacillus sp. MMS20-IR301]WNS43452.1 TetR/AcrR family transcriptional regulator [Paenibacillus sp. MMS20-IR301]
MDRRIGKTREAIFTSFISLMAGKNFEQITINEIAERANVSRGTVYLHFVDKYDLLDQCIETQMQQLCESCLAAGEDEQFASGEALLRTAEYLERHAFVFTTLLNNKGVPAFRTRLHAILLQGLSGQIEMDGLNRGMNKELLLQFLASAVVGVMEWWITHSMPYPAKDMIADILNLMERNQMVPRQPVP